MHGCSASCGTPVRRRTRITAAAASCAGKRNDDATAERIAALFAGVGITAGDVVPWNA